MRRPITLCIFIAAILLVFSHAVMAEQLIFSDDFDSGDLTPNWITGADCSEPDTISVVDGKVQATANCNYIKSKEMFSGSIRIEVDISKEGSLNFSCFDFYVELIDIDGVNAGVILFDEYGTDGIAVGNVPEACGVDVTTDASGPNQGKLILTYAAPFIEFAFIDVNGQVLETGQVFTGQFDQTRLRIWLAGYQESPRYIDNVNVYQIAAPPRVANFFVQHRVYEDGREFNRFYFTLRDEANNIILDEIAADVKLTDPNGQQVPISDLEFAKVRYSFPWYDGNTGQWIYSFDLNGELFHDEGEYFGVVPDPLVEGYYQLTVTDEEGNQYVGQFRFNGYQGLPIIRSSSFKYKFDKSGNMIWTWKVPYDFNPTFDTSVRPFIKITNHDGNNSYLFPKVPTHLGRLFVPNYVVDKVKEEGDQYEMIIDLRTNDNNNRTYSKARKLKFQKHHTKEHKHPKH